MLSDNQTAIEFVAAERRGGGGGGRKKRKKEMANRPLTREERKEEKKHRVREFSKVGEGKASWYSGLRI